MTLRRRAYRRRPKNRENAHMRGRQLRAVESAKYKRAFGGRKMVGSRENSTRGSHGR